MADLRCARTRLPIPGTYTQRTVQVTETVRAQEPPDYVTQLHTVGAGVYCSPACAVLHMAESMCTDGELSGDAFGALTAAVLGVRANLPERRPPCLEAEHARRRPADEEPF